MSWLAAGCVFVGGGLGAALRWLVSLALNPLFHIVPLGTLAVNLIGGYLVGVAAAYFAHHHDLPPEYKLFAITGILGGFTTFSTYALDLRTLVADDRLVLAVTYLAGTLLAALLAAWLGITAARRVVGG